MTPTLSELKETTDIRDTDAVIEHDYSDVCQCQHCRHETMIQNLQLALDRTFQWSCHRLSVGALLMELKRLGYQVTEFD